MIVLNNIDEINYYIKIVEEQNLSVRELRTKIKNNEYERLPEETKLKLVNKEENTITQLLRYSQYIKKKPLYMRFLYYCLSNNQSITFLWIIPSCDISKVSVDITYLG